MRLQQSPIRGTCLPTSFAMAMGIPVADIFAALGHDGSEVLWPDLPEPTCQRGFHVQELIRLAVKCGWSVTPIERTGAGYCLVDVPAGRDRPYTVDGTIYLRKNTATAAASQDEVRALVEGGFR